MKMNMEELYDDMKRALKIFGLRFSEMDKVTVYRLDGFLYFTNGDAIYGVRLYEKPRN